MCDTLVAVGEATADNTVILAKNSDRQPNEAHTLAHIPRTKHAPGSTVRCTYIEIPQVSETYEVLLSKPFWIWGGEMGANECGVAMANEAVFTREPYEKGPGLTGMDLLRLALERADTARKALDVTIELLATHGQGGNCGFQHPEYYHNSFIIADARSQNGYPGEAWVLETAGQYWAAERVRGVRTISNGLTIGSEWDLASPRLVEHAMEKGWCKARGDFHFARCYSDFLYTNFCGCRPRQARSTEFLASQEGRIGVETMMLALRDHGPGAVADPRWTPGRGWLMDTLCVHASLGPTRPSQSTGAMIAHLTPSLPTYWLTGTSGTCTSIFKPVYLGGAGLPDLGPVPTGTYDPGSLWWSHERLHRTVIRDFGPRLGLYEEERDSLEAAFLFKAAEMAREHQCPDPLPCEDTGQRAAALRDFTAACFGEAAEATTHWTEAVHAAPAQQRPPILFSAAWDRLDRQAGFPRLDPSPKTLEH